MADSNFQPIFDYIDRLEARLEERLVLKMNDVIREEMGDLKTSVANLAAQVKQIHDELLVSGHRVDRLEYWAKRAGDKIDTPLVF